LEDLKIPIPNIFQNLKGFEHHCEMI